jgi:hypothetical protein
MLLHSLQQEHRAASLGNDRGELAIWFVRERYQAAQGTPAHQTLLHIFHNVSRRWRRHLWYALVYQSKDTDRALALEKLLRGRHGDWLANQLRAGLPRDHHPASCEVCSRVYRHNPTLL